MNKSKQCSCGPACKCKNCRCGPYALFFDTLGNTTRFAIIDALLQKPLSVNEIAEKVGIEQTLTSHSLKRLELCGFVIKKTQGKHRVYSVNKQSVVPLLTLIDTHVKRYCSKHTKQCSCSSRGPQ